MTVPRIQHLVFERWLWLNFKCRGVGSRPPNPANWLAVKPLDGSNAVWSKSKPPFVSAIAKGKRIGRKGMFPASDYVMAKCIEFSSSVCYGPWRKVNGRYLGLKFVIKARFTMAGRGSM